MLIDLPYEAVCKITTEELKETLSNIRADYEARKNGKLKAGVYDANREIDLKKIKKTIRAVERVLKYYGVNLDA
jgi:translation initiation factor 1 (eIF-1/SUI1)